MFHPKGPTIFELINQGLSSTKKGYDLLAPKFDYTRFMTPPAIVEATANYLRLEGSFDCAIDLCTGTGAGINALLPIVREKILGVDWSEPMLTEARRKFPGSPNNPIICLACEDIFNLQYLEEFDLATCFGALGHIEKNRQKEFAAVVHSILRPGGIFAFVTSEKPSWLSATFWLALSFDWTMKIRNLLIQPKFIMYYLNFLVPEALALFDKEKWISVKIMPMEISGKLTELRLVVAKKK